MSPTSSITHCIDLLKRGDRAAAGKLWDAYVLRLVALARARIGGASRRAADEEDVALSAFDSFYRRAEGGQFARLSDREDLWQILVFITERKAIDLMRREGRKVRALGRSLAFPSWTNTRPVVLPILVPPPSSRPRSPTNFASSWSSSPTTHYGGSRSRRWRAIPTARSPESSAASSRRSSVSSGRSDGSGPGGANLESTRHDRPKARDCFIHRGPGTDLRPLRVRLVAGPAAFDRGLSGAARPRGGVPSGGPPRADDPRTRLPTTLGRATDPRGVSCPVPGPGRHGERSLRNRRQSTGIGTPETRRAQAIVPRGSFRRFRGTWSWKSSVAAVWGSCSRPAMKA